MKLGKRVFAIVCLLALLSSPAVAEFEEGDKELTGSLSFFHQQDSDTGSLTGDAAFGYFLTKQWEAGFRQSITSNFVDGGSDTWVATTSPFLRFNFQGNERQSFVPYLGVFTGVVWNDRDVSGTAGPEAGFRSFITDAVFVAVQYRYEWFFNELSLDDSPGDGGTLRSNSSDGNHVASIGLGVTW